MEESMPSSNPGPFLKPSVVTSETQSSVLQDSPDTFSVDNDISDLLMDSFGIVPRNDDIDEYDTKVEEKFVEDLDLDIPLLAEIFDDLQNVGKSENNSVMKEPKNPNEAEKIKEDSARTLNDIEQEIEYEIELDRVERLRKPKFQTMPAYEKRAKQEAQWRAAVRSARRASSLHSTAPYKLPAKFSGGSSSSNLHPAVLPILPKDSVETSSSLNISSLDLDSSSSSLSSESISNNTSLSNHISSQPVDNIVRSSQMVNTKKHLSAANHFPANSRLFNRSLKQLQSQADAISAAYLNAAAARNSQQNKAHVQASINVLNKTTNITRFLKDVNCNPVLPNVPFNDNIAQRIEKNESHLFENADVPSLNHNISKPFNNNAVPVFENKIVQTFKKNAVQSYNLNNLVKMVKNNNNSVDQSAFNRNVVQTPVVKARHIPVYRLPDLTLARIANTRSTVPRYLLVDPKSSTTSVIQKVANINCKSKVSLVPSIRPKPIKKAVAVNLSSPSCYNCQKLARVLPYLAHSRRKLTMHSSIMVSEAAMVLVCEVCGELVRETVIFGDYIVLDHVSTAHFPSFLVNSESQGVRLEDTQNCIKLGDDWD